MVPADLGELALAQSELGETTMTLTICLGLFLLTLAGLCACLAAMRSSQFTHALAEARRLPKDLLE